MYKASAQPLQVILSGGIGPQNDKQYLIGQRVGASVETGGLQATSYLWSISGGKPFKGYSANESNAVFTGLSNETNPTCDFYFAKPVTDGVTVACAVWLQVPPGALPAEGFHVTLSRGCAVDKPWNSLSAQIGSPQGDPPGNPTRIHLYGVGISQSTETTGIIWIGTVTTPSQYGAGGGWNYTQLVWPQRTKTVHDLDTNSDVPQMWDFNGLKCLDTYFGYAPRYPDLYPADSRFYVQGDEPSSPVGDPIMSLTIHDSFETYTLYQPPGDNSCLVPLKNLEWFWGFGSTPDASHIYQVNNPSSGWSFLEDFPAHPEWDRNVANGAWILQNWMGI